MDLPFLKRESMGIGYSKEQQLNRGGGLDSDQLKRFKKSSTANLKKNAIKKFNAFIRERDRDGNFFFCHAKRKRYMIKVEKGKSNFHAGHYFPAGQFEMLRFDESNVLGESMAENYFSGSHLIGMRQSIIERFGQEELDRIEMVAAYNKRCPKKWTRIELIEIILKYEEKIRNIKE